MLALPILGTGTTEETFQHEGGQQHVIEWLKSLVIDGAISSAVNFIILADMSSGPLAFDVSKNFSNFQTSSTEHMMSEESSRQSLFIDTVYRNELAGCIEAPIKEIIEAVGLVQVCWTLIPIM